MAVAEVFDVAIPSADAALFTNGERAVCVASAPNLVPLGTYYLSKRIELPPGVYFLKAKLAPGGSITIAGTTITSNSLIQTQVNIPAGEQRIDITLSKNAVADCYAALTIFLPNKVFYASSGDGWVWDTTSIALGDVPALPDARLSMPVFSVRPNWSDSVNEWVSYLTDVMTSETAVEQRRAVRVWPRRSFEASFLRKELTRARLDTFLTGIGRNGFLLPLWHEQFISNTGVVAAESFHQFPTDEDNGLAVREFQDGDAVLIDLGDPDDYEVCIVSTANATTGQLGWSVAPSRNWPAGVHLTPLRKAVIKDRTSMANRTDRVGTTRLRFELTDPLDTFEGDWGGCSPIWQFPINRASDVTTDFDRLDYSIDNSSGPVVYSDPGNRALLSTRLGLTLRGRRNVLEFRRFMAAARGRAIRFYSPSFTQGIVPIGDIDGPFFDAKPMGFADMFPTPQAARRMIAFVFKDGSPTIYRTIQSVIELNLGYKVERYVLDAELPPIKLSQIERIEFMVPSRFDQDTFELSHPVDGLKAVGVSTILRSVEADGMPPLTCDVTTPLYPVEVMDAMDTGFDFTGGQLRGSPTPLDAMDVGFAITACDVRQPLITYNLAPEAMDNGFTLNAGFIGQPLVSRTLSPEAIDAVFTITNGTLAVKLVSKTLEPEAMDTSFALSSGVFSVDPGTQTWDLMDIAWDDTEETWDNTPSGTYVDI